MINNKSEIHCKTINFAIENPPFPFLHWDEISIKKWLKQNGFDLNHPIFRCADPRIGKTLFRQDNSKWLKYDKLA